MVIAVVVIIARVHCAEWICIHAEAVNYSSKDRLPGRGEDGLGAIDSPTS